VPPPQTLPLHLDGYVAAKLRNRLDSSVASSSGYGTVKTIPQFCGYRTVIRPLDVATIETDIIQHPNKHVTFGNNFSVGLRDWGWALGSVTAYNTLLYYCYNWH